MAVVSGLKMASSEFPSATAWRVDFAENFPTAATAGTDLAVTRGCPVEIWEGEIVQIGYEPVHLPGASFTFAGSIDGSVGCSGSAIVRAIEAIGNYAENRWYTINYEIVGNGLLTFGSASASDSSLPTLVCPAGKAVKIGANAIDNVRMWSVRLEREILTYVSSGSSGARQAVAGAKTATVTIDCWLSDDALPAKNTYHDITIEVGTSETPPAWKLENFILSEVRNYGVDLGDAGNRNNLPMYRLVFVHVPASSKVIKTPGNAQFWPTAT